MKRQSGTEHCAYDNLLGRDTRHSLRQRSLYAYILIFQHLAHLVRHGMTYAHHILTEAQAILLHIHVAQFTDILVYDSPLLAQIHYFHSICC